MIRRGALRSIVEPPLFLSPDNTLVLKHAPVRKALAEREERYNSNGLTATKVRVQAQDFTGYPGSGF